ncbi:MFS transporter [Nocardia yunnanensis]|uniref:MFS transporter n=1 Tax=Nocardia yunnanensis TaxID=2382165 RepID=A0A386ZJT3_9NOCA|nr:MFS transporter [Nocardia yunnanensis]AYF77678.1 MFS transporter [Nocardia yunnanensis]
MTRTKERDSVPHTPSSGSDLREAALPRTGSASTAPGGSGTVVSEVASTEPATRPARESSDAGRSGHEKRVTIALFAAGLTTFAAMYSTQSLLPSLSAAFHVPPAHAALAVSLTTGFLALAIIPAGVLAARVGRTRVMVGSAVLASVLGLLLPLAPSLDVLLGLRAAQGVALAGVPAVAMAYLAEEIGAGGLGAAMGVYIAGTTIGGLAGRLIPSIFLGLTSWRWAEVAVSVAAGLCTVWFARALPPARGFTPRTGGFGSLAADLGRQLRRRELLALFGLAFLLMGSFVSVYNYLGYRLTHRPFELPAALAGSVFVLYLAGTVASACAGRLADRRGHHRILVGALALMVCGALVTVPDHLPTVLIGILLFTTGFFGAHTVASAWVGALAENRGAASSLYMFAYYLGSAVIGSGAGIAYAAGGWIALIACVSGLFAVAALLVGVLATAGRRGSSSRAPGPEAAPAP